MIYTLEACRLKSQQLHSWTAKYRYIFAIYIYLSSTVLLMMIVTFGPLEEMRTLKGVSLQYATVRGCHS